jgi:hypothetical protein
MPMPISNLDEYDKVVNVSWFTPEKAREELTYVHVSNESWLLLTKAQISMCAAIFSDVSPLLHRHSKLSEPILFLLG